MSNSTPLREANVVSITALCGLVATFNACKDAPAAHPVHEGAVLTSVAQWSLAEDLAISGAHFYRDSLLAWNREAAVVWSIADGNAREMAVLPHLDILAAASMGTSLQVVDGFSGTLVSLEGDSAVDAVRLPTSGYILAARAHGPSWLAAERRVDGIWAIWADSDGVETGSTKAFLSTSSALLARNEHGDWLIETGEWPTRVMRGAQPGHLTQLDLHPGQGARDAPVFVLSAVAASNVLLVTIGDPREDRRDVIRICPDGTVQPLAQLDAPLGLLSASETRLYALVTLKDTHIIEYKLTPAGSC